MATAWRGLLLSSEIGEGRSREDPVMGLQRRKPPETEQRKQSKPPEEATGMKSRRLRLWLRLFQLFSVESYTKVEDFESLVIMKNQGSRRGTWEQARLKLFEVLVDFHLLQTEVMRRKEEVGSHERTLSRTSSLRSSMGKAVEAKVTV